MKVCHQTILHRRQVFKTLATSQYMHLRTNLAHLSPVWLYRHGVIPSHHLTSLSKKQLTQRASLRKIVNAFIYCSVIIQGV